MRPGVAFSQSSLGAGHDVTLVKQLLFSEVAPCRMQILDDAKDQVIV